MAPSFDNPEYPHAPRPLETDTLVDSVLMLLVLTVVQRLVGFVRAVLFCRWLDPEQLGLWDMSFSFLVLASPLAVLAIPGAFGRYVERYRQQGQLREFLRRTASICAVLAVLFCLAALWARHWLASLLFGLEDRSDLVVVASGCLITVAAFNFLVELFTALRKIRLVSVMQLVNSAAFAVLGLFLLAAWKCTAESVLIAYSGACLITAFWAGFHLRSIWRAAPPHTEPLPRHAIWDRVAPLAGWILLSSALTNLFGVIDRYMIVHFSKASPIEALDAVGNYHSSRVVPLLLISIAAMLATMVMPHMSHDWENNRRDLVVTRLRLFLKLFGFGMFVAVAVVLSAAPLLFNFAFQGKFQAGEAVLPWTLMYCTWFGLFLIAQNYLLCAEKARLISVALGCGLVLNVLLNLMLLPRFGLAGAVLSTCVANALSLGVICFFNHRLGFHLDDGAKLVLVIPAIICLGAGAVWATIAVVTIAAAWTNQLLSQEEKHLISDGFSQYGRRIGWITTPPA